MAGIKISALPVSGAVLGTDVYPAVQAAATVKQTVNQLTTYMDANVVLGSVAQVTGLPASLASFLPLAGGIMTGQIDMGMSKIISMADPTNPQDAATKAYVDVFASGFTVILAADAASVANVPSTQAGAGVGATLTDNSGTFAPFSIDGVSPALNSRILIKDQTLPAENGVYVLTTNGDGIGISWVLTRATDYDQPAEIQPGTLVAVNTGTVNATTSWLETATVATVDTDPVLFSQFTFAPSSFFQIANNLSEGNAATMRTNLGLTGAATMALPVSAANGGTGVANANTITLGGNVVTAGAHTLAGAFASTFTFTAGTSVTFPTSGTLITDAQPTINQPNIVGTTTNDSAAAGSVGEYMSSVVLVGAAVALTTGVSKSITSIALTPGDWDVGGEVGLTGGGTTRITWLQGGISQTNNTFATFPSDSASFTRVTSTIDPSTLITTFWVIGTNASPTVSLETCRISVAINTTVYLVAFSNFTVSTCSAYGKIMARRVR